MEAAGVEPAQGSARAFIDAARRYAARMAPYERPLDRFLLGLDHLEVSHELLLSETPAKERMAVILLDGLADGLIFRRLELLYEFAERGWWYRARMPEFPKRLREKARAEYHVRLSLARRWTYLDEYTFNTVPFADDHEATVLLIGHAYRNDAYHRDRHNPAVIGIVGRLMFAAVAALFARSQPAGVGWGINGETRLQRLARYEVDLANGFLQLREAAEKVGAVLGRSLTLATTELIDQLADDLEYRLDSLDEGLQYLATSGRDVGEMLAHVELWSVHGADERLLELANAMDPMTRAERAGLTDIPDEFKREAQEAMKLYRRRQEELAAETKIRASLGAVESVRKEPERLRAYGAKRKKALARYHEADRVLSHLEDCAEQAIRSYDEALELEFERSRGN